MLTKIYFVSVRIHEGEAKPLSSRKNCHWPILDILKESSILREKTPKFQHMYEDSGFIFIRTSPKTLGMNLSGPRGVAHVTLTSWLHNQRGRLQPTSLHKRLLFLKCISVCFHCCFMGSNWLSLKRNHAYSKYLYQQGRKAPRSNPSLLESQASLPKLSPRTASLITRHLLISFLHSLQPASHKAHYECSFEFVWMKWIVISSFYIW